MLEYSSSESLDIAFAPPCETYTVEQLEQDFVRGVSRWSDRLIFGEDTVELLVRLRFREQIERILRLVKNEHQDQTRWEVDLTGQPLPYTVHLLGAALRAVYHDEDGMVVCGVLTHDLLEDTRLRHLRESALRAIFQSDELTYLSQMLSKVHFDEEIYGAGESYTDTAYYSDLGSDTKALRIKGYDRWDNLASFGRLLISQPGADLQGRSVLERSEHNVSETKTHLLPLFERAISTARDPDREPLIKVQTALVEITRALAQQIRSTRSLPTDVL